MKTYNNLYKKIYDFKNLLIATKKAFRNKKKSQEALLFWFNQEKEILSIESDLINMKYKPMPYRWFKIYEPKERNICAACFKDRVVHHAICNIIEPIYENSFINHSYACRKGKGVYAAMLCAQKFSKKFNFFLKCDIQKYFETIDHNVLKSVIRRKIRDKKLLHLLDTIIDHPFPKQEKGKGIPIGNLTSQIFANLFLDQLDHFIKDELGVKGYVRYMDDFLLFSNNKKMLHEWLKIINEMISYKLCLNLKEKALLLMPVTEGMPFLGFRIFPGMIRLQRTKLVRFIRKLKKREQQYHNGEIDKDFLIASVESMLSHISLADTYFLQRSLMG